MTNTPHRTFARPRQPEPPVPGLRRGPAIALGIAAALALCWAGTATWYIMFRDEFAQAFMARQAEMRIVYEDRVGDLKNRLEREITSGLVERKGFGARVEQLSKRQAEIEARQLWLNGLAERLGPGQGAGRLLAASGPSAAPLPAPEVTGSFVPVTPGKPVPVAAEPLDLKLRRDEPEAAARPMPDRLSAVESSLRRVSDSAIASTDLVRQAARNRAGRLRQALETTRLPASRLPAAEQGTGGPFVPLPDGFDAAAFAPIAAAAEDGVLEVERLSGAAKILPLGRPLAGELEQTSSFGYRVDPFNRSAALHTGIDFRAEHGAPVRATAAGRVVAAEPTGGYGLMVEVEHEQGVSTRYAHMSGIAVAVGQKVEAGQIVGRAGSTGRSTGTHLHYETRIDGEPVNPSRFLEAGRLLAALR